MPSVQWKQWERDVALVFGGKRRGCDVRGEDGGKTDVISDHWAIEVKLLGAPTYSQMLAACYQAEENAESDLHEPVAVIRRKSRPHTEALVVYRLSVFAEWRLK